VWVILPIADVLSTLLTGYFLKRNDYKIDSNYRWTIITTSSPYLIFVITWFAGLFYIVRLFVYQIEAAQNHRRRKFYKQNNKIMTYIACGISSPGRQ
jgi:uncharacterized membrane protein